MNKVELRTHGLPVRLDAEEDVVVVVEPWPPSEVLGSVVCCWVGLVD